MKITKKILFGTIILLFFLCLVNLYTDEDKYFVKRKQMVETQIKARGIKDRTVLEAMLKVPRHKFVPLIFRELSYMDKPLAIGEGQTISQPYIVALMTEVLQLSADDRVLEIGTGSGYQAAILSELTKEVYTIEIVKNLSERAEAVLKELGYKNIKIKCGDGYLGWPEFAPFDAIIITCAVSPIPQPLLEQLADGGRLVFPLGEGTYQDLTLIRKEGKKLKWESIIGCRFVPMTGDYVR